MYAYFNNDVGGHAPRDALTLRRYMSVRRRVREECQMTRGTEILVGFAAGLAAVSRAYAIARSRHAIDFNGRIVVITGGSAASGS